MRRYGCCAMMLETVAAVLGMVGRMLLHLRRWWRGGSRRRHGRTRCSPASTSPSALGSSPGPACAAMSGELPDLKMLALFGCGVVLLRGAGCTVNDLLDRDIDNMGHNAGAGRQASTHGFVNWLGCVLGRRGWMRTTTTR